MNARGQGAGGRGQEASSTFGVDADLAGLRRAARAAQRASRPTPVTLVPRLRDQLQDSMELYVDGGVMIGADVAAAVGLGADGVLIGRAYLYGLMAGGQAGVARVLELLQEELTRTMQRLGVNDLDALRSGSVRQVTAG